jgi:hypothetical protein
MVPSFFFTLLFVSTIAAAVEKDSLSKLTLTRHINLNPTATYNPVKRDRQRAEGLNGGTCRQDCGDGINTPADNKAIFYMASIGVGNPATNCK